MNLNIQLTKKRIIFGIIALIVVSVSLTNTIYFMFLICGGIGVYFLKPFIDLFIKGDALSKELKKKKKIDEYKNKIAKLESDN